MRDHAKSLRFRPMTRRLDPHAFARGVNTVLLFKPRWPTRRRASLAGYAGVLAGCAAVVGALACWA